MKALNLGAPLNGLYGKGYATIVNDVLQIISHLREFDARSRGLTIRRHY